MNNLTVQAANKARVRKWTSFVFYPTGVLRIWKGNHPLWVRLLYTLVGLPPFFLAFIYLAITGFAFFLPPLDLSVGNRADRTVINSEGNYKSTFLKTAHETGGTYELIQVEVEPKGGNGWHYHKSFDEYFTVLKGKAKVGLNENEYIINEGDSATAKKGEWHYFANPTDSTLLLQVKTMPARGLEKSIRVAYGLINDGQFEGEITKNPWHMALLLGYSGTYLPEIPGFIQEPLVNALAKIAQWKGEDKALEKYYR
ncbi:cupin domain-containing protein [Larkinella punicea]|uniref:Cupin domain-containing protein n=1 Tax=Larkinella punicea TaxID=2315727 RepID=A0A368JKJ1_9BACT|nr:cupin domain-containing protein [Larkinella punicea]RCR68187.1 cupin domain-containing protein [Larkinella punicea]